MTINDSAKKSVFLKERVTRAVTLKKNELLLLGVKGGGNYSLVNWMTLILFEVNKLMNIFFSSTLK